MEDLEQQADCGSTKKITEELPNDIVRYAIDNIIGEAFSAAGLVEDILKIVEDVRFVGFGRSVRVGRIGGRVRVGIHGCRHFIPRKTCGSMGSSRCPYRNSPG